MENGNNKTSIGASVVPPFATDEKHEKDDTNKDPNIMKRALANREYSHKYRMKQLKNILQLETEKNVIQAEVEIIGPRIRHAGYENSLLRVENGYLKQRLSAYYNQLMSKEVEYGEFARERDVLKQIYETKRMIAATKIP